MLDLLFDEHRNVMVEWRRDYNVHLAEFFITLQEVVTLLKDLENAKLMVSVDVGDEDDFELQKSIVYALLVTKMVIQLSVASFRAVH